MPSTTATTNTNLSNLGFADDILLISGSLKHTTTMLDDFTTATTAHGFHRHSTKTKKVISHTTSKNQKHNNMVTVQVMNIETHPAVGNIKYLGQLTSFNSAVPVEFDYRIKCAWAAFTSQRQGLSPKYCDATVWYVDDDGREMKKKLQPRMMRMIIQTKRNPLHVLQLRTPRTSTKSPTTNHTTQIQGKTRPRSTHMTPTSKRKATKTPTATLLVMKFRARTRTGTVGRIHSASNAQSK